MSERKDDYEVGYGKPPKATRFKKGQSGNPKGRPKGAKGVKASVLRELEEKVTVRDGGRETRITKAEALAKGVVNDALKGNAKARAQVLGLEDAPSGDGVAAVDGQGQISSPEPADLDILCDYFMHEDKPEDGGDDDGA